MARLGKLGALFGLLRIELMALGYAALDARSRWPARLALLAAAVYAVSPIDLIPDFLPFAGWIDDLIIAPALLWLAERLTPAPVMADARERARAALARGRRIGLLAGAALLLPLLVGLVALAVWVAS